MSASRDEIQFVMRACPRWVSWIAQDADGSWWGYEVQPLPHDTGWYENEVGRSIRLSQGQANPAWMNTLCRCNPA